MTDVRGKEDLIELLKDMQADIKVSGPVVSVPELKIWFVAINSVGGCTIQYTVEDKSRTKRYLWKLDVRTKYRLKQWLKHRLEVIAYQQLKDERNDSLLKYLSRPLAVSHLVERT